METVRAIYLNHVDVLQLYDDWFVRSPSTEYQMPAVVMTRQWIGRGRTVKFSRSNVFLRDNFVCSYCTEEFSAKLLTLDHVVPVAKGGRTTWENCVAACADCNHTKGMKHAVPKHMPYKPTYGQLVELHRKRTLEVPHASWNDYLNWPSDKVRIIERKKMQ
jgi:5-methylcytosine-specific restriction endonuclease McrA